MCLGYIQANTTELICTFAHLVIRCDKRLNIIVKYCFPFPMLLCDSPQSSVHYRYTPVWCVNFLMSQVILNIFILYMKRSHTVGWLYVFRSARKLQPSREIIKNNSVYILCGSSILNRVMGFLPPYLLRTEKIAHVIKSNFVFQSENYNKHKTSSK